jgi:uncharacterized protein (DUF924 family)
MSEAAQPQEIVSFWREAGETKWFAKDPAFDAEIRERFGAAVQAAASGALGAWEDSPEGALALLILLDQMPRNLHRGEARAFAGDAAARGIADRAIVRAFDLAYRVPLRRVFYLPFMHAEDLADQERCIALCAASGDAEGVKWGEIHADIIRRFGRFPHRNPALGRAMRPDEQAFLDGGGFAG